MRHNIVKRPVGMVTLRTPHMIRDASSLRRRMKYGIRRIRYNPLGCYSGEDQYHLQLQSASVGFTVIELLIVVVIIAIAAMAAIPMLTSADSFQIRSAANMIAADLEYAKTISISRGQSFSVVFDDAAESYRIEDQSGVVIGHPVKKGFDYIVDFQSDRRLSKVDIESVNFDATSEVKFDYLGSPYNGADNPLNSGVISLRVGQMTATVNVEPITGFISITD